MTPRSVCILAGGRGSRLAGVWDRAKCLAPIGPQGTPLLQRLLTEVFSLQPGKVFLLLGIDQRAREVARFLESTYRRELDIEKLVLCSSIPAGTAAALRDAIPAIQEAPVLVLNGDTLPLYELRQFVHAALPLPSAAWYRGAYAGAAMLDALTLNAIRFSSVSDFDQFLPLMYKVEMMRGFHDIGTPEAFNVARFISLV